jgi:hypothetical protein
MHIAGDQGTGIGGGVNLVRIARMVQVRRRGAMRGEREYG